MKHPNFEKVASVRDLVAKYEVALSRGSFPKVEETVFRAIVEWYLWTGRGSDAQATVGHALGHYPESLDLCCLRSQVLLSNREKISGIESLQEVLLYLSENQHPLVYRAEWYALHDDVPKTIEILENLKSPLHVDPTESVRLSWANFSESLSEQGELFDSLAEIAIRQLQNEDVLAQIWLTVEIAQNYRDSYALHETILDQNIYNHHAWYNLGFALRNLGEPWEALDALEYSFIINPEFEAGYREFAAFAFELGRYRTALYCYQEMVSRFGEESEWLTRIGECFQKLGDSKIARVMFDKALKINPHNAETYFRIGECHASRREYKDALKWLREAIRNEERRDDFHASLSEVCYCLGHMDEAIKAAWRAVEIAPDEQVHWIQLTRLNVVAGQVDEALDILDSALENVVEKNELLYLRSACLFLSGDRRQGIRELKKALNNDFSRREALFYHAPALAEDSDVQRVIQSYQ